MRKPAWSPLVVLLAVAAGGVFIFGRPADLADATDIVGQASVIDGDTIRIGSTRIRFYGIDAPEGSQQCMDGAGSEYRCGRQATSALDQMMRGKTVHCSQLDTDQYGRAVAICSAEGIDLNGALVDLGFAVAYRQYSWAYVPNEVGAWWGKKGLWAGSFEMPWDYRRTRT